MVNAAEKIDRDARFALGAVGPCRFPVGETCLGAINELLSLS